MATGTIRCIKEAGRFGFIKPNEGFKDVFFHADDLDEGLDFDERLVELVVRFDLDDAPAKGPRARNVRLTD